MFNFWGYWKEQGGYVEFKVFSRCIESGSLDQSYSMIYVVFSIFVLMGRFFYKKYVKKFVILV